MQFLRLTLALFSVVCLTTNTANAQSTWTADSGVNLNWSTAGNWSNPAPASNGTLELIFNPVSVTAVTIPPGVFNTTNDLTNFTASGITFDNSAASPSGRFVLSGNQITLGGNIVTTGSTNTPTHIIGMAMVLNGDRTITTATGNNVNISGALTETGGSRGLIKEGSGTLTLSGANNFTGGIVVNAGTLQIGNGGTTGSLGSGGVTVNTAMTFNRTDTAGAFSNTISGSGTVTKTGSGTISLSGNNSYTGQTTVSTGVLNIQSANALGSTSSGTAVSSGAALQIQGGITTAAEALTLNGTGISNDGALRNISGNNTYTGSITLASTTSINSDAGTLTLDVASGNAISGTNQNVTFGGTGNITVADAIATAGTITKLGSGTLTLSAANTYSGGTTWGSSNAAGVLSLGNNAALGTGTLTVSNSGAASNNWIQSSDATARTISNNITVSGSTINFNTAGTGDLTFSGSVNLGGGGRTFNIGNTQTTFSGVIGGTSGNSLTKGGTGTLILSGANTYSGNTTVSNGTLQLGNGGTGGSLATTSTISVSNGATFSINQSDTVIQGTDFSGSAISGAGGFTQGGTGTTVLTAANTYTGATTVSNGTLQLGNGGTGGALSPSSVISVASGATFSVNQSDTVTQGVDFSGSAITGQGGFAQNGSGTTILTANNTYTGATTVNAGTLRINGNQSAATGNVTVASGATLGGSGTIGGATTISGIHSPGNSPGLQTFNGGLTYLNGSSLTWELAANTTIGRGTNFDGIDVTGGVLTINPGVTSNLVFNGSGSLVDWNNVFWAVNQQWLVYDNANAPTLGSPIFTTINVSNDSNNASLGSIRAGSFFSWVQSGNDIFLRYNFASAVVPEPGTFGLMGLAGLIGVLRHRRRRKEMSQV